MGADSKIEWTHHTFNPWVGCTNVSPGCDNCYAEAMMDKRLGVVAWGGERKRTSEANWKKPLAWNARAKVGERQRVFCASLADVFDNQVPNEWRLDLWRLIARTPHLDWLLLTKRPQNIHRMLPGHCSAEFVIANCWPWPNVWLGTTVENQEEADRRIPHLLAVRARVHFLSCEPLLGPVNLADHLPQAATAALCTLGEPSRTVDWVICGGESGPNARPIHPDWARSLRDQCAAACVPFFFKQWGEWHPCRATVLELSEPDGIRAKKFIAIPDEGTDALHVDRDAPIRRALVGARVTTMASVGKRRAGRELDGRTHDEFPR